MDGSIPCAGAIIHDDAGRLLLVRRAHEPGRGRWSIPGGRCLADESTADACVREVREETGLVVVIDRVAGSVERLTPGGDHYEIHDFVCHVIGGKLLAGDDAVDARWLSATQLHDLESAGRIVDGLAEALRDWECWPD